MPCSFHASRKADPVGRPLDRRARLLSDDAIAAFADSLTAAESAAADLRALAASVVHHAAALDAAINIGLSWTPTPNPAPQNSSGRRLRLLRFVQLDAAAGAAYGSRSAQSSSASSCGYHLTELMLRRIK